MTHGKVASLQRWSDIIAYSVISFFIVYIFFSDSTWISKYKEEFLIGKGVSVNFAIAYLCGLLIRGILIAFDVLRFENVKRDINIFYPSLWFSVFIVFLSVSVVKEFVVDVRFWSFGLIFFVGLFYIRLNSILVFFNFSKNILFHPSYRAVFNSSTLHCFNHPITEWSMDEYNFRPIVNNIVNFFSRGKERCIGLYGDYGVGKTSAVNLLEHDLKNYGDYVFVRVSSWGGAFDSADSRPYVVNRIVESLSEYIDVCYMRHSYSDFSKGISTSFGISLNVSSLFFPRKTPEQWLKSIDDLLLLNDIKVVVVFEDIDRSANPEFTLDNIASFVDFLSLTRNLFFIFSLKPTDAFYNRVSKICQKSFFIDGYDPIPEFNDFIGGLHEKMSNVAIKMFSSDISFSYAQAKAFYPNLIEPFGRVNDFSSLFQKIIKTPRDWKLIRHQMMDDFDLFVGRLSLDEIVILAVLFYIEKGVKSFFINNFDSISLASRTRKAEDADKVRKSWEECFLNEGSRYADLYTLLSLYFFGRNSDNSTDSARIQSVVNEHPHERYYYNVYFKHRSDKCFFEQDIIRAFEFCNNGKDAYALFDGFVKTGFFPKIFLSSQLLSLFVYAVRNHRYIQYDFAERMILEGACWFLEMKRGNTALWRGIVKVFDRFRNSSFFSEDNFLKLAKIFYSKKIYLSDFIAVGEGFFSNLLSTPPVVEYYLSLCDEDLDTILFKEVSVVIDYKLNDLFYPNFGAKVGYPSSNLSEFDSFLAGRSQRVFILCIHALFLSISISKVDVSVVFKDYVAVMRDKLKELPLVHGEIPLINILRDDALSMSFSILNDLKKND